ncbi:MAG: DUF6476 family protein [Paracoccus sp. (in: a-proteobacteria)]|nr:DUF6476 family protein [Paracoccus sp. (in: a-proteobacteria)]
MAEDHNDWRETAKAVPELGFLRALVTALSVVMGLGMIAIVAILWMRLGAAAPLPELPENITLPQNETPAAITFARDWIVVVTGSGQVLLYDRAGALRQQVQP